MRFLPPTPLTVLACLGSLFSTAPLCAAEKSKLQTTRQWASYFEPDAPFFSTVLDCRELNAGGGDNLTVRGLVLQLGQNYWACFDIDLLRLSCVWRGDKDKPPFTTVALAPRSYQDAGQKTKDGQDELPHPIGTPMAITSLMAGWQLGDRLNAQDPRPAQLDAKEIGRGPAPDLRFISVSNSFPTVLKYQAHGVMVQERLFSASEQELGVTRCLTIGPRKKPLMLVMGEAQQNYEFGLPPEVKASLQNGAQVITLPPGGELEIKITLWKKGVTAPPIRQAPGTLVLSAGPAQPPTTQAAISSSKNAYVLDAIPPPLDNSAKRNIRLADIAFLNEQGNAAAVTYDGDVWAISGLVKDLGQITWRRFSRGFHEPMGIVARKSELFVHDRNGLWQLIDSDNDGNCEEHRLHCGLFTQTAETREFPNSLKLGPDGSFFLAKGGQQGTSLGKDNGCVLKIAPDGLSYEVVATGLRQPFIGVSEKTGLITASDQQGNYVPSTPLHIIEKGGYYGHLATVQPKEKYPATITEPLTWIPHPVNPSSVSQVWLHDSKLGPLDEGLLHICYNRPDLLRVIFDKRQKKQAAVCRLPLEGLNFAPLNAKVNPADGCLYLTGFQIWGTIATDITGLARLRYTGAECPLPSDVSAMDQGVLLRFECELDATLATDPRRYVVGRWNYKRSFDYGSPHYKLDGTTGQELIAVSSAYLSKDKRSVFLGVPDMKSCHQLDIGWNIASASGQKMTQNAYTSPWALAKFEPEKEGFEQTLQVDLTPRKLAIVEVKASLEEGQRLYQFIGCMGCHSVDGSVAGRLGPSWKGLYGSQRKLSDGKTVTADEAYLKESIIDPSKKKVKDYLKLESGMPIYAGILNDSQLESLILYIKSLQ